MNVNIGDEIFIAPNRLLTAVSVTASTATFTDSEGGRRVLSTREITALIDSGIAEAREGINFNRYPIGTVLGLLYCSATKINATDWIVTDLGADGTVTRAYTTDLEGITSLCRALDWEEIHNPNDK